MNRQSAPRAACQTARGSLCHSSRAVSPAAMTTRATLRERRRAGSRSWYFAVACLLPVLDRRHLHRNCSRDHRRALGAGLHSALSSSRRSGLASRTRAVRQSSGRLGSGRFARLRAHVPRVLGRAGAAHSLCGDVRSRVGRDVCAYVGVCHAGSAKQDPAYACSGGSCLWTRHRAAGLDPLEARTLVFSCCSCRPCSCFRTRISAPRTPKAIASIARTSRPISSGTRR